MAWTVLIVGMTGIVILSMTYLILTKDKDAAAGEVMSSVLPLFASWIGTVLAFYFARENLAATTRTATQLVAGEQLTPETPASVAMLRVGSFRMHQIPDGQRFEDQRLAAIFAIMRDHSVERVPVLDVRQLVCGVIHRSALERWADDPAGGQGVALDQLAAQTVNDLKSTPAIWAWVVAHRAVKGTDTLTTVRTVMQSSPECSDVFVTTDGTLASRVEGWIPKPRLATMS